MWVFFYPRGFLQIVFLYFVSASLLVTSYDYIVITFNCAVDKSLKIVFYL